MALNVTTAAIAPGCNTAVASPSLAQWDQGQILQITGIELPETYQVEFSGGGTVRTVPMLGGPDGVEIPNALLQSSHPITAYIVLHEGEDDRETKYWITIYVRPRQAPESTDPDPEQLDIIDQAIAALQGVEETLQGGTEGQYIIKNSSDDFDFEWSDLREGHNTTRSGLYSHAEGWITTASGQAAHAEGIGALASGYGAHAENAGQANGYHSHAEGITSVASGVASHAEGQNTKAQGTASHSEGFKTTATHLAQHVFGQYNAADPSTASGENRGTFVEIVGNGTGIDSKSNARTLDWSGNESLAGNLTLNAGSENEISVSEKIADLSATITAEQIEVSNLKHDIEADSKVLALSNEVALQFEQVANGSINASTGEVSSSSAYKYTNYIDVSKYDSINYKRVYTTSSSASFGVALYDENKTFIQGKTSGANASTRHYEDDTIPIPSGAKYLRATTLANLSEGTFSISGVPRLNKHIINGNNLWAYGDVPVLRDSGIEAIFLDKPLPAGTYTIRASTIAKTSDSALLFRFSSSKTTAVSSANVVGSVLLGVNGTYTKTFTISATAYLVQIIAANSVASASGNKAYFWNITLTQGSSIKEEAFEFPALDAALEAGTENSGIIDYSASFTDGGYIALASDTANVNAPVENSNYRRFVITCSAGDEFVVMSFGQSTPRAWGFVDASGNVLARAEAISGQNNNLVLTPARLKAPPTAAYLVVNHYKATLGYAPKVYKLSSSQVINQIAFAKHTLPYIPKADWKKKVVAAYGRYVVINDGGVLKRSDDCGLTWNAGVNVSSVGLIKSYHMYATGTLGFFTHTKAYYTDNFTTFSEAACYESNGSAYVPGDIENFYTIFDVAERKFIGNQDMYVFGNYVTDGAPETRALLWYSIDNGHSYKVAYEFNTNSTYAARHVHVAVYYEPDDKFIVCTGDTNATQCRVIAFAYDAANDTWSNTVLGGPSRAYKWAYVSIWGDEIYFSYDNTPGQICKCKYSDIGDSTKHEVILDGTTCDAIVPMIGKRGDMIVTQSHHRSTGGASIVFPLDTNYDGRKIYYSNNRKDFAEIFVDPQILDSYTSFSGFLPLTYDGHFICGAHGSGTETWDKMPSVYLDEYVRLAGFNDAFKPF